MQSRQKVLRDKHAKRVNLGAPRQSHLVGKETLARISPMLYPDDTKSDHCRVLRVLHKPINDMNQHLIQVLGFMQQGSTDLKPLFHTATNLIEQGKLTR